MTIDPNTGPQASLNSQARELRDGIRLATFLAHEITNPMTIIACQKEMLRRLAGKSDDNWATSVPPLLAADTRLTRCIDALDQAVERVFHIQRLIFDLYQGDQPPMAEKTFPIQVVERSLRLLPPTLAKFRRNISVFPEPNLPAVEIVIVAVQHALANIIVNAIEAGTPNLNERALSCDLDIRIRVFRDGASICISVTDFGQGFIASGENGPPSDCHRRGRGLEISRQLLSLDGGSLEIRRQANPTIVCLRLPVSPMTRDNLSIN